MSLTSVIGMKVGHWSNLEAGTGCTVLLCPPEGCVASGSVRGGAPGTRETALLEPEKMVDRIHGIVLSGGSAFGLASAEGVMQYLYEQNIGFVTPFMKVPIVPAAVIFDYKIDVAYKSAIWPSAEAGYIAAKTASSESVKSGRIGAGTGATCGKYLGNTANYQFGGLGTASTQIGEVIVAALSVNNPIGDIINPDTSEVVAGAILSDGSRPTRGLTESFTSFAGTNTTLVVVVTNAILSKAKAKSLAEGVHAGIARAIRPSHTPFDGDCSFVLSTCQVKPLPLLVLATAVQEVVISAILAGARAATTV